MLFFKGDSMFWSPYFTYNYNFYKTVAYILVAKIVLKLLMFGTGVIAQP